MNVGSMNTKTDQTSFSGMDVSVNMYSWRIHSRVCAFISTSL